MTADAKEELASRIASLVLAEREACADLAGNIKVEPDCEGKELLAAFHQKAEEYGDPARAFNEVVEQIVEFTGAAIAGAIRMRRQP